MKELSLNNYEAQHFLWRVEHNIGRLTLNRPEKKNPLTFDPVVKCAISFETWLTQTMLCRSSRVLEVTLSGGDVHEIIGPLVEMDMVDLMRFTRMTGDVVRAMRACPQIVIAAVDGICAGAGAILAMASDLRYGTRNASTAFLFTRVGLQAATWVRAPFCPESSARAAADLLFSGRNMS